MLCEHGARLTFFSNIHGKRKVTQYLLDIIISETADSVWKQ